MNLPWLLCLAALGIAFFGQARMAGSNRLTALAFTYFLLSMPLLNTHVALAGYADLFMGACYAAAIMAFCAWSLTRENWQAWLALFFAICCPLVKNEGLYWMLTFVPALIVVLVPPRKAIALFAILLVVLLGTLLLIPQDFVIAGHNLAGLKLFFRSRAPGAIATSIFAPDNWHLLAYMLTALVLLSLTMNRPALRKYSATAVALACALALYSILFTLTSYAGSAIRFTAIGRTTLHLVPSLTFFAMLLWNELSSRSRTGNLPQAGGETSG